METHTLLDNKKLLTTEDREAINAKHARGEQRELPTIEEIEQQLAIAGRLKEKPKPVPRVSRPVDLEDVRRNPENYVRICKTAYAHRCEGRSRQQKRRCRRSASTGSRWCKFHGSRNRGPITPEGLAKCAAVNLRHGEETGQARRDRKAGHARARILRRAVDDLLTHEQRMRKALREGKPA